MKIVASGRIDDVFIALDYFDASINRIAAWTTGLRNFRKALLIAMLTPHACLQDLQNAGELTELLVLQEELKGYPWGAVYEEYCRRTNTPVRECEGIIHFPSAQSKFMIKYDEKTKTYLSLTSLPTGIWFCQRNVLGLAISQDLIHWETADVLISDREILIDMVSAYSHSFQYVDFDFDGNKLRFIVREAADNACTYHDGTHITMYTVFDYPDLIKRYLNKDKK